MAVIIASVIVGLVAGAVGSVLGAVVTRALGRRERRRERDAGIGAEDRAMIEQRLGDCDEATAAAFGIVAHLDAGHPPPDAYDRTMARRWERSQDRPLLRWEPDRINDKVLKALTQELDHTLKEFDGYLESVASLDPKAWRAETQSRVWQLERLKREVRQRLDELRW
jgi:hypothetical protein